MQNSIIVSTYGAGLAIGLQGNSDFIQQQGNRFFNHGAIAKGGGLIEMSENFSYFVTSEERVKAALANDYFVICLMTGESKRFKKNPKGLADYCRAEAEKEFASYERENFMGKMPSLSSLFFATQTSRKPKIEEDFHFEQVAAKAISSGGVE